MPWRKAGFQTPIPTVDRRQRHPHLGAMFLGLALPSLALIALAILVPRIIERWMPETVLGMATTAAASSFVLWALSACGFALLYQLENPQLTALLFSTTGSLSYFTTLGAKAVIIWGPVLALVISTAPRRWTTNTW